jgi:hypothetical protein
MDHHNSKEIAQLNFMSTERSNSSLITIQSAPAIIFLQSPQNQNTTTTKKLDLLRQKQPEEQLLLCIGSKLFISMVTNEVTKSQYCWIKNLSRERCIKADGSGAM